LESTDEDGVDGKDILGELLYHIPHLFRPPLHHEKIRNNHGWPDMSGQVEYDSTLTYDRRRRCWTFNWVYEKDALVDDNQVDLSVVALDPGVVSFYTFFSPTHGVGHIARNDIQKIVRLSLYLDKLISSTTSAPMKKRSNMRRAQARIRQRIRNLVDELHKKVALWLVRTFDIIVLPAFRSAEMSVRRPQRKIGSKTVRKMMTWGHGRFLRRLKNKAEEMGKSVVVLSSEAYTSKTCSRCGVIKSNLGGARVFRCKSCGYVVDRDVNGARGIFLRALRFGDIILH
jgi:putative transposase